MLTRFPFWVLILTLVTCVGLLAIPVVHAEKTITLKLSHQWAQGDVRDQWARLFAKKVDEKSQGSIKFEIYPAAALFKAKAQYDAMRTGTLDMCVLPVIYVVGKIPQMAISSMPCLIKNANHGTGWRDAPIGNKIEQICEDKGMKFISWGWLMGGLGSKTRAIHKPPDVKGQKMRGAGKAVERMLYAGGAAITSMPSTELYFALQTGTLDGLLTTYSSFMSFRLYEVLKYLTIGKDYHVFNALHGIFISPDTWKKLSAQQQKTVLEAGRESEPAFLESSIKTDGKAAKIFAEKGVNVHFLTGEEFQSWKKLSQDTAWKRFAEKVQGGKELLDMALAVK